MDRQEIREKLVGFAERIDELYGTADNNPSISYIAERVEEARDALYDVQNDLESYDSMHGELESLSDEFREFVDVLVEGGFLSEDAITRPQTVTADANFYNPAQESAFNAVLRHKKSA